MVNRLIWRKLQILLFRMVFNHYLKDLETNKTQSNNQKISKPKHHQAFKTTDYATILSCLLTQMLLWKFMFLMKMNKLRLTRLRKINNHGIKQTKVASFMWNYNLLIIISTYRKKIKVKKDAPKMVKKQWIM